MEYILKSLIWILAIYGLIDIIKDILATFSKPKINIDDTYIIIAVKNKSNSIENLLRNILFKIFYMKDESNTNVIVTDLGSNDETTEILNRLKQDYNCLELLEWQECKTLIDNMINKSNFN